MYKALLARDVALTAKPFALGLRVEHPQALIDGIQYGQEYAAGSQPAFCWHEALMMIIIIKTCASQG